MSTLQELLNTGRVERVPADLSAAADRVDACLQHLTSAAVLADSDPAMAYAALYDAARKAITAHMLARGLRATNRPGAHEAVGLYGVAELTDPGGSVARFQGMRLARNRSEYQDRPVGRQEVANDLRHAAAIVEAVRVELTAEA